MNDVGTTLDQMTQEAKDYVVKIKKLLDKINLWNEQSKTPRLSILLPQEPTDYSIKSWKIYLDTVKAFFYCVNSLMEARKKELILECFEKAITRMPKGKTVVVIKVSSKITRENDIIFKRYARILKREKSQSIAAFTLFEEKRPVFIAFCPDRLTEKMTMLHISSMYTEDPLELQVSYV